MMRQVEMPAANEAANGAYAELRCLVTDLITLHMKIRNLQWLLERDDIPSDRVVLEEHATSLFDAVDELSDRTWRVADGTLSKVVHSIENTQFSNVLVAE